MIAIPPAWVLSLTGIGLTLAFGAWKLAIVPRLGKHASSSPTRA